jgi:hypothetical protein
MASGGPSLRRNLSRDKAHDSVKRLARAGGGVNALRRDLRTTLYINIANIVNLFKSIDGNDDGIVTPEEFKKKLTEIGIELTDEAEFQALWDLIDIDRNGSLCVRELQGAIARCARTVLCPDKPPPPLSVINDLRDAYGDGRTATEEETLRCSMVKTPGPPQVGPANLRCGWWPWAARDCQERRPGHWASRYGLGCSSLPPLKVADVTVS